MLNYGLKGTTPKGLENYEVQRSMFKVGRTGMNNNSARERKRKEIEKLKKILEDYNAITNKNEKEKRESNIAAEIDIWPTDISAKINELKEDLKKGGRRRTRRTRRKHTRRTRR